MILSRPRYRLRRSIAGIIGAALLGGGMLTVVDSVAGPVPSASACTWGPWWYSLWSGQPDFYGSSHTLWSYGEVSGNPDIGCGSKLKVYAQRKVCGFWGCNYHNYGSVGPLAADGGGWWFGAWTSQWCISGTHRYRTVSVLTWPDWGGEGSALRESGAPEYWCW